MSRGGGFGARGDVFPTPLGPTNSTFADPPTATWIPSGVGKALPGAVRNRIESRKAEKPGREIRSCVGSPGS